MKLPLDPNKLLREIEVPKPMVCFQAFRPYKGIYAGYYTWIPKLCFSNRCSSLKNLLAVHFNTCGKEVEQSKWRDWKKHPLPRSRPILIHLNRQYFLGQLFSRSCMCFEIQISGHFGHLVVSLCMWTLRTLSVDSSRKEVLCIASKSLDMYVFSGLMSQ